MPSHSMGRSFSRRKMAASRAVEAGVVEAMRVALPTLEYCRPENWAMLLKATPVSPMSTRAVRQSRRGRSGLPRRAASTNSSSVMSP